MKVDGPGVAMVAIGGVLVWSGVKGYGVMAVIQNLVTGKPILTNVGVVNPIEAPTRVGVDTSDDKVGKTSTSVPVGGNRALGQTMAAGYGWTGAEWTALETLWTKESGWRNTADNPTSHAYGIPQALPFTKMSKMAWPPSAGGSADAATQIAWGLNYIKQRYGSPSKALKFHLANNWY